jgi:methylphosphotriester-DNA--protein-cysteine methyltransferase
MFALKQSSKKILTKAVADLENTLLATNSRKHTYDEIDKIMTTIASDNKITQKQLHNAFKKKHGVSPDEWIEYQEVG